ncbi:MAG: CBASS cGAMP-activated phospholipase [Sediminibacterium sp.]
MTKYFTILSIDGGGIRGIIPAKVLAELETELRKINPDKQFYEHFDLICGTSTGAILAIGIALGIPPGELVNFYKTYARIIFPKWYLKVLPRKARVLVTSIYSNKQLRKKLKEIFSEANGGEPPLLNDLKTNICIPAFNGNMGEITVLKTKHNKDYLRDYKLPAHEVALSSASAPVYFPPHSYSYDNEFGNGVVINMIDGGIFANNPTLIGILEATDKLNIPLSDLKIISIGTGKGKHIVKKRWRSHNFWYWFIPKPRLLEIILDSQAQITEQYVAFIQRINAKEGNQFAYVRVQYEFGEDIIDLNASSKKDIDRLEAIGDELAKKNLSTIINLLTPKI